MSLNKIDRWKRFRLENGQWLSKFPLGYIVNGRPRTGKWDECGIVSLDEEKSKIVKDLFNLYATQEYSTRRLGKKLMEMYPKFYISNSQVAKTISNSFYIGIMVFKGEEFLHKYPLIIDKDLFDRCQTIKTINNKYSFNKKQKPLYPNEIKSWMQFKIDKKEMVTGGIPCGYKFTEKVTHNIKKDIILDESKVEMVKDIFNMYSSGNYTSKELSNLIHEKYGIKYSESGILNMTKNEFYIGILHFRGTTYKHRYPLFISEDIWNKCREVAHTNKNINERLKTLGMI